MLLSENSRRGYLLYFRKKSGIGCYFQEKFWESMTENISTQHMPIKNFASSVPPEVSWGYDVDAWKWLVD